MQPVLSQFHSICCSIISIAGIFFLLAIGILFDIEAPSFTESVKDPKEPHTVAKGCYVAAGIYAFLLFFCSFQAWLHSRKNSSAIRL